MQKAPKNLDKKRAEEKLLVSEMIALYCRKQHHSAKGTLCPECRQLHDCPCPHRQVPVYGNQDFLLGL